MTETDLQLLAEKMLSEDPDTREEAFYALNDKMYMYDDFEVVVIQVTDNMVDCDKNIQLDVLNELPNLLGLDATRIFVNFLTSPFPDIRSLVTLLLSDISLGQENIYAVAELLEHKDPDVRSRAVEVLSADGQEELCDYQSNSSSS
jgi:hypothetical protein